MVSSNARAGGLSAVARSVAIACAAVLWFSGENRAGPPAMEFNTDYVARCRDVTPAGCKCKDKKLVEATFRISALLVAGKETDLEYCLYTIYDGKKTKKLYVEDYLPKTELKGDVVDPIVVIESNTNETNLSGTITAGYKFVSEAELKADRKTRTASTMQYKKLPPLNLLVASGITERGYGVFCKMKPSSQATIEGDRFFSCIFAVPKAWRGDYLYVKCQATGYRRGISGLFDDKAESGLAKFALGLYLEGDSETEGLVKRLAGVQQGFLDEVARRASETNSDWLRKIESSFGLRPNWSPTGKACCFQCRLLEQLETNGQAIKMLPPSLRAKYDEAAALQGQLESCSGD